MGISILIIDHVITPLVVDGSLQDAVRLNDAGKPSETADAAVAKSAHAWAGREMPSAAILPDGRVVRWESGLHRVADTDITKHPLIGRVAPDDDPPVLLRSDGTGRWSRAEAQEGGVLDANGRLMPWRRPRITEVVGREITRVVAPNESSSGPMVRSFTTFRTRMSDGSEEDLASYWHVPPDYAAGAENALLGLPMSEAFEWLLVPLRRRAEADARVLCTGGHGLEFRCGDIRLRLQPVPGGEIMFLEGLAGHPMVAGPAMAAVGDRGAMLARDLVVIGGDLRLEVLGLEGSVLLETIGAGLRITCRTAEAAQVIDIPAHGVRTCMADLSGYLAASGDLSVEMDAGGTGILPTFSAWIATDDRHPSRRDGASHAP